MSAEEEESLIQRDDEHRVNINTKETSKKNKLGVFFGVFVPSMLGAFGVIVFERMGWLTAQGGVIQVMVMFLLGYLVTMLSVLSLAAIATNGEMKGGGTYYLVSRSLGPEFGGSIGVMFFLANITGAAFYMIGFGEAFAFALQGYIPDGRWWLTLYESIALALMILICFIGAGVYAKASFFVWILICASLVYVMFNFMIRKPDAELAAAGFTGISWETLKGNMFAHYAETDGVMYNFRTVFGIVFPAITGLIAGSNMSGDLKNPGRDIPRGTIMAAATTFAFYGGMILLMGATVKNEFLLKNYFIYITVSYYGKYIVAGGIWCAVLASGLASLIGGARVLQAIARDDLIWILTPFKRGSAGADEPRLAVMLSWIMCQGVIFIGSINVIAPFITMFYMISFLSTNFACFLLSITGAPNFRPSFKYFHWSTALAGALLSMAIMFYTDPVSAAISLAVVVALFFYILFRAPDRDWGDISQALMYHQIRKYLLRLDARKSHVKFWRPQILLMVSNPRSSFKLINFVDQLKKSGLYVVGHVIEGNFKNEVIGAEDTQNVLLEIIEKSKLKAFAEVVIAKNVRKGFQNMLLLAGMGGMKPNTIVLGYYGTQRNFDRTVPTEIEGILAKLPIQVEKPELKLKHFVDMIKDALLLRKNVIVAKNFHNLDESKTKHFIDCWLVGRVRGLESDLSSWESVILLLGNIIARRRKKDTLRVLTIVDSDEEVDPETSLLKNILDKYRIQAQVEVYSNKAHVDDMSRERTNGNLGEIPKDSVKIMNRLVYQISEGSRVTFLPLPEPPMGLPEYQRYMEDLDELTANLGPTLLVRGETRVLTNSL
eukprot:TRINITY_DN12537_c0_g1_i1.p1 TRINITY_DN12537_c0_g1~~TRINITY_DN12537_c0_g1_i1.p1  ORF type:complete len:843 (+),score=253.96 TRINITY_DN12537_c0_g1_i1:41-2530(+)